MSSSHKNIYHICHTSFYDRFCSKASLKGEAFVYIWYPCARMIWSILRCTFCIDFIILFEPLMSFYNMLWQGIPKSNLKWLRLETTANFWTFELIMINGVLSLILRWIEYYMKLYLLKFINLMEYCESFKKYNIKMSYNFIW